VKQYRVTSDRIARTRTCYGAQKVHRGSLTSYRAELSSRISPRRGEEEEEEEEEEKNAAAAAETTPFQTRASQAGSSVYEFTLHRDFQRDAHPP